MQIQMNLVLLSKLRNKLSCEQNEKFSTVTLKKKRVMSVTGERVMTCQNLLLEGTA
jgi:hypothetical protein